MRSSRFQLAVLPSLVLALAASAGAAVAQAPALDPSTVQKPQPTVPEVFSIQGQFVRVAYNNEGFVTLGYKLANESVGEDWMYLQAGVTLRKGTPDFSLTREAISIKTPDGKVIPLATQKEYAGAGYLRSLNERGKITRDPLNYFPADATRACTMSYFADLGGGPGKLSYDQVELSSSRACVGRLFFKVPGGIQTGQHWLVVKFAQSEIQVPFRILTKEEEKFLRKNWEDLQKALEGKKID
jgi:hypothetical protein